ncbi:MAG: hypothetical protein ABL859_05100, partial [Methylotenera sp.]
KIENENKTTDSKPPETDDAACKAELQCWAEKNIASGDAYCQSNVEKLGQYSSRWTDGMLELKFSRFRWLNKENSTLTYIGDKIELQNGYGAYQPHIYECDFDPATNSVIDVRAYAGRL